MSRLDKNIETIHISHTHAILLKQTTIHTIYKNPSDSRRYEDADASFH